MTVKLTFLGTGTSQGVPMIACPCEVCRSIDPRDKRLRTSALVQVFTDTLPANQPNTVPGSRHLDLDLVPGSRHLAIAPSALAPSAAAPTTSADLPHVHDHVSATPAKLPANTPAPAYADLTADISSSRLLNIVIDGGPDFRTQMLAADVRHLDAILLTHEHKDHTGGLDDVRAFNYFNEAPVDIWATERVQQAVRRDYAYAFDAHPYPGAPEIRLHDIPDEPFDVKGVTVVPIRGLHMKLPVTGFRIGNLAYLTDFNHIEESEIEKLRGVEALVVNAIGHKLHISHFNLEQAIELGRRVGASTTYLTHMAHRIGLHAELEPTLPAGVHLAYDGLTIPTND